MRYNWVMTEFTDITIIVDIVLPIVVFIAGLILSKKHRVIGKVLMHAATIWVFIFGTAHTSTRIQHGCIPKYTFDFPRACLGIILPIAMFIVLNIVAVNQKAKNQ